MAKDVYTRGSSRVLEKNGQEVFNLDRVNLGNCKYALSPTEADELSHLIVRLLNEHETKKNG